MQVGVREVIQGWDKAILGEDDLPPMKVGMGMSKHVLVQQQSLIRLALFSVQQCHY